MSLIYFYELDHDATVVPVEPPIGRRGLEPVISGDFIRERMDAITVA